MCDLCRLERWQHRHSKPVKCCAYIIKVFKQNQIGCSEQGYYKSTNLGLVTMPWSTPLSLSCRISKVASQSNALPSAVPPSSLTIWPVSLYGKYSMTSGCISLTPIPAWEAPTSMLVYLVLRIPRSSDCIYSQILSDFIKSKHVFRISSDYFNYSRHILCQSYLSWF